MRVSQNLIGVRGDECQCGRRQSVAHCPSCGSTRRYARSNRMHKLVDGSEKFVKVQFRCMTCGHEYIDEERALCEAPPVGSQLATQKVRALHEATQSGEYLSPKEVKLIKAIETVTGTEMTQEQKEQLEIQIDFLLRQAWADAVFAHKSGKGENPGALDDFKLKHREEVKALLAEAKK